MLFTNPLQVLVLAVLLLSGWLLGYASAPDAKKWKRRVRQQSDSFSAYYADAEDKRRAAEQRATDLNSEAAALRADHAQAERTIADLRAAVRPVAPEPAAPPAVVPPVAPIEEAEFTPVEQAATADSPPPPAEAAAQQDAPSAPEGAPVAAGEPFPSAPAVDATAAGATARPAQAAPPPTVTLTDGDAQTAPAVPSKGWFGSGTRDDLTRIRGIDGRLSTRLFGLGVVRFEDIEKLSAEDEMALEQRLALPVGLIGREQWRTQATLLRECKTDEHAAHFAEEPASA